MRWRDDFREEGTDHIIDEDVFYDRILHVGLSLKRFLCVLCLECGLSSLINIPWQRAD